MQENNIFGGTSNSTPENTSDIQDPNSMSTDEVLGTTPPQMESEGQPVDSVKEETAKPVMDTVVLSASEKDKALAKGRTIIGTHRFDLPDVAEQLAGFQVEKGGVLVSQFPQYKFKVEKGDTTPSVTI